MNTYRRVVAALLIVGLLACAYVAVRRYGYEHRSKQVEIALDFADFAGLAQSYGYDPLRFLRILKGAGVTSLAIQEQQGQDINGTRGAMTMTGQNLIDQARLGAVTDPALAALVRSGTVAPDATYIVVFDPRDFARLHEQSIIHFGARDVRVRRTGVPSILEVRTQVDFFNATGFGLPADAVSLARAAGLWIVPRVQNDENFGKEQIDGIFDAFMRYGHVSTVVFFGTRLQVLGYPNHLASTARAFGLTCKDPDRHCVSYGSVEYYVPTQDMRGNEELAGYVPGQTTRVLAIARPELDQLTPGTIIARYLLGVRERNIRVVYFRPVTHVWGKRTLIQTNRDIVAEIAAGLRSSGFRLGPATPIPAFRINPLIVALATLAVPAIFLSILEEFGVVSVPLAVGIVLLDLIVYGGAVWIAAATHHPAIAMFARKAIALSGALLFPIAGSMAIAPAFRGSRNETFGAAVLDGLRLIATSVAVTLGGVLVVVGLLSTPLMMEEIDRFTGVKLILIVPPLAVLVMAVACRRFGAPEGGIRATLASPVRVYQLALGVIFLVGAFFLIARSGNETDVGPTAFELALRQHLTSILSVRPRFKEFAMAWPLVMLLPALGARDLRRVGWIIALGLGVGLADVVDTFSHLHTPLSVSILRLINGLVVGVILGVIVVALYRRSPTRLE